MLSEERFWSKVNKTDTCWLWLGCKIKSGYGQSVWNGKVQNAHRVAYQLARGEIPAGMFVCHHCDVKVCVNPDHLFLGTPKQNSEDACKKGLHRKGSSHGASKLKETDVKEILTSTESSRVLGKRFGVDHMVILRIKRRVAWRHV